MFSQSVSVLQPELNYLRLIAKDCIKTQKPLQLNVNATLLQLNAMQKKNRNEFNQLNAI